MEDDMKLITVAGSKKTHPTTLEHDAPCMMYNFNTGNKYIVWMDGTEFFFRSNGNAMSKRCERARSEMRELAKSGIKF
jgi:hypothetical protein